MINFNVNPLWDTVLNTVEDHDDWSAINIIFARTYSGSSGILNNISKNTIFINTLQNDIQPIAEEYPF